MKTSTGTRAGSVRGGAAFVVSLLLAGAQALPVPCAAEDYRSPADGILRLSYADGLLSLETRDAPLGKVLDEFARLADVNVVSDVPLEDRITVYVSDLPPDAAARKILRGKGLSFVYRATRPAERPEDYPLSEIRIYDSGGKTPGRDRAVSYGTGGAAIERDATPARREPRPPARSAARARALASRTPRDEPASAADSFLTGLLGGDLHALDEVAERLRREHPEAEAQIQQFMQALDEAKARAAETGSDAPSLESLGGMGAIMHRMMQQRTE